MAKISRIQLRGISRTPSDRLTEDGGLSESLNMYLDTSENAPAFIPEDVTSRLGLPASFNAKRVFIHKTPNYENIIAVQDKDIISFSQSASAKPIEGVTLVDGEDVNDITSIGNTLIVSTTKNLYYILYQDNKYTFLGTTIPFLYINFDKVMATDPYTFDFEREYDDSVGNSSNLTKMWFLSNIDYAAKPPTTTNKNDGIIPDKEDITDPYFKEDLDQELNETLSRIRNEGYISGLSFFRYSITLYDDRKISSLPILIKNDNADIFTEAHSTLSGSGPYNVIRLINRISGNLKAYYVKASCLESELLKLENWTDIIKSVDFYVSHPSDFQKRESYHLHGREYDEIPNDGYVGRSTSGRVTYYLGNEEENLNVLSGKTHLVKSIPLVSDLLSEKNLYKGMNLSKEILDIVDGIKIDPTEFLKEDSLEAQEMLTDDDMKHYTLSSEKLGTFNNRLLVIQPSQVVSYDYNRLNACDLAATEKTLIYDVSFILKGSAGDLVVKKRFVQEGYNRVYAYQVFPDNRAYKMIVKVTDTGLESNNVKHGIFDMVPHPYLDCSYFYDGINNELIDLCTFARYDYAENIYESLDNKLFMSEQDNPFFFPIESRYTFQSKVLGIAIATTALSQGQFGQFPLYVFTEDGIWAMETASDGSFISQKPVSRDVCINPDSITSIDNAVVFVTAKGVMMISGSQVVNISPFMNGKHYHLHGSAKNIINAQEGFCDLIDIMEDDTPFMTFMKDASVAYDYNGQRLIFISKSDVAYQYVYKIDTQTWHKIGNGEISLSQPLNSYPECLVANSELGTWYAVGSTGEWSGQDNDASDMARDFHEMMQDAVYRPYIDFSNARNLASFLRGGIPEIAFLGKDAHDTFMSILNRYMSPSDEWTESHGSSEETIINKIYSLSTVLDAAKPQPVAKGCLITRPLDLGEPDVYKTVTDVRIRGQFPKGAVKFIILGSNDGINYATISTLRGKSWKMFRFIILADLDPTDRISWIDVQYDTKFTNRLR